MASPLKPGMLQSRNTASNGDMRASASASSPSPASVDLAIEDAAAYEFLHDLPHRRRIVDDEDLGRRGDAVIGLHDGERVGNGERLEQELVGAQPDRHFHGFGSRAASTSA